MSLRETSRLFGGAFWLALACCLALPIGAAWGQIRPPVKPPVRPLPMPPPKTNSAGIKSSSSSAPKAVVKPVGGVQKTGITSSKQPTPASSAMLKPQGVGGVAMYKNIAGSKPFAVPKVGIAPPPKPVSLASSPRGGNPAKVVQANSSNSASSSPMGEPPPQFDAKAFMAKAQAQRAARNGANPAKAIPADPGDNRGAGPAPMIAPPPQALAKTPYDPKAFMAKQATLRQQRQGGAKSPIDANGALVDPGDKRTALVKPPAPKPPPKYLKPFTKWQDIVSSEEQPEYNGGPQRQGLAALSTKQFYTKGLPTRKEGVKLHVSADPADLDATLVPTLNVLRELDVPHKLWDPPDLAKTAADPTTSHQAGKFITIYPKDNAEAFKVAQALNKALPAARHQPVEGDAQVFAGKAVYMRYGGHSTDAIEVPDNYRAQYGGQAKISDNRELRAAKRNCPEWKQQEFNQLVSAMRGESPPPKPVLKGPPAVAAKAKSPPALPPKPVSKVVLSPRQLAEAQAPKWAHEVNMPTPRGFDVRGAPAERSNWVKPKYVDSKGNTVKFEYKGYGYSSPMTKQIAMIKDAIKENPKFVYTSNGVTAKQGGRDLSAMYRNILAKQEQRVQVRRELQKNGIKPKP